MAGPVASGRGLTQDTINQVCYFTALFNVRPNNSCYPEGYWYT